MDDEESTDADPAYIRLYQSHLEHVASHLIGSEASSTPSASYFYPCGFWTSEEKDAFFHGLQVHSRSRPDLIAAEIKTKTVVDVSTFLNLLAAAAAEDIYAVSRKDFEGAVEVSDAWLEFEEEQSMVLAANEPAWDEAHVHKERNAFLKSKRAENSIPARKRKREVPDEAEQQQRMKEYERIKEGLEAEWEKEDFLGQLSVTHLKVIDSVIREAEETSLPTVHGSVTPVATSERAPSAGGDLPSIPIPVDTNFPIPVVPHTSTISDDMIDPALLAMSNPPPPGSLSLSHRPATISQALSTYLPALPLSPAPIIKCGPQPSSIASDQTSATTPEDEDVSMLSPRSRRRYQKRLYMRRKRAQLTSTTVSAQVQRLKPGRKTNKRSRFKMSATPVSRATSIQVDVFTTNDIQNDLADFVMMDQMEDTMLAEEKEYMHIIGGKEEMQMSLPLSIGLHTPTESENLEESMPPTGSHSNISGLTLPYKIKAQLTRLECDAQWLQANALDMFHLSTLGKLMNLYASTNCASDDDDFCTQIAAEAIQLLHAHMIYFVTDLIHRSIVLREEEEGLKEHTKVWRLSEHQIKASTVHQALVMMGAEQDKEAHFDRLKRTMKTASDESAPKSHEDRRRENVVGPSALPDDGSITESDDAESDENDETGSAIHFQDAKPPLPTVSVRRELNLPFISYPSLEALECYLPQSSSLSRASAGDNLMSKETDEATLLEELLEEDELDALDRRMDIRQMASLWNTFGRDKYGQSIFERTVEGRSDDAADGNKNEDVDVKGEERTLRLGPPRDKSRVKSNVYVVDSD